MGSPSERLCTPVLLRENSVEKEERTGYHIDISLV
jgi:hypothetical protein